MATTGRELLNVLIEQRERDIARHEAAIIIAEQEIERIREMRERMVDGVPPELSLPDALRRVRDLAVERTVLTAKAVVEELGVSNPTAHTHLQKLVERGVLEQHPGRPIRYRYVPPPAQDTPTERPRVEPPELRAVASAPTVERGTPVAQRRAFIQSKDVRRAVEMGLRHGCRYEEGTDGHGRLFSPSGEFLMSIAGTPQNQTEEAKQVLRVLRQIGCAA